MHNEYADTTDAARNVDGDSSITTRICGTPVRITYDTDGDADDSGRLYGFHIARTAYVGVELVWVSGRDEACNLLDDDLILDAFGELEAKDWL